MRIAPYRSIDRGPSVNMDDAGAAFEMTSLLLEHGHQRIGFIKGHPDHGATHLRFAGYAAALRARGVPLQQDLVKQGDFTAQTASKCAEELLSSATRPTAIFASNDEMALGVMLVASRLGLQVPRDLSVVGFDDDPVATLVWPRLTTVRQPISQMSGAAVELLLTKDTAPGARLMDYEIIIRGSAGYAA